jgi:hypothetical protein
MASNPHNLSSLLNLVGDQQCIERAAHADWDGCKAACPIEVEKLAAGDGCVVARHSEEKARGPQPQGALRGWGIEVGGKARKTVAILQAASGCYSIVTIRHRTFRIIYIHSGSYVSVQVADAARIADRSFLPDPTSSSVIAPICLTPSKGLEPTRDYPEAHNSSSSRLVPNTILRRYPPPAFPTSAFPRPVSIFRITFRPDTISSYGSLQQHY